MKTTISTLSIFLLICIINSNLTSRESPLLISKNENSVLFADTCYFINVGDTIYFSPSAPSITVDPSLICVPSIITVHIAGSLKNIGAKWVIYGDQINAASILGTTRSNSFIDSSLNTNLYFVREEGCVITDSIDQYNIIGIEASAAIAYSLFDMDNDGTDDCLDGCPLDPLKIVPGYCGCGNPETDTDLDYYPNCIDEDDDNDSITDDLDNCILISNSMQVDSDGDDIGDVCDAFFDIAPSIDQMKSFVNSLESPDPIKGNLLNTLQDVMPYYCSGHTVLAENRINTFTNKVKAQKGNKIPNDQANKLEELAMNLYNAIKSNIAICPSSNIKLVLTAKINTYNDIIFYPNPVENYVNLKFNEFSLGEAHIIMYNLQGHLLHKWKIMISNKVPLKLNFEHLKPGVYFLNIKARNRNETIKLFAN